MREMPAGLPEPRILQQAAQWFATLGEDPDNTDQHRRWRAWLNDHPEHQRAWYYVEQVSRRFQQAQQQAGKDGAGRILNRTRAAGLTRRKVLGGGVAGLAIWLSCSQAPMLQASRRLVATFTADHRTGTGEIQQLGLTDGGRLWLNSASAVGIDYGAAVRNLTLYAGEILIQTGPDPRQRPFIVTTRHGTLRALGTRFTVRDQDHDTLLAVYQGAVEIRGDDGGTRIIEAGRQARFTHQRIEPEQKADRAREAWSGGVIVAADIPLGELVAELARYRHGYLGLAPELAPLRVIGTYPAGQPDLALAMLEKALPVRVNRLMPWWVTLAPE